MYFFGVSDFLMCVHYTFHIELINSVYTVRTFVSIHISRMLRLRLRKVLRGGDQPWPLFHLSSFTNTLFPFTCAPLFPLGV
ncbi:hypothetical protein GDO81_013982 [Engystomops pustulosus]|uniref:Uncharacterized protein n=1 Tax=Engystomops pustulosus TaxID=76066 RepID=A0AAV7B755_ENGPU|nr:hypothetical protein GDO81_013982 [Engystomops pustulosus]